MSTEASDLPRPSSLVSRPSLRLWTDPAPSPVLLVVGTAVAGFMAVPLVYILYRGVTGGTATWRRLWQTRLPELLWHTLSLAVVTAIGTVGLARS